MALTVVDASVVIAFLDAQDAHHRAAVTALAAASTHDVRLPASAYAEVLVAPAQQGRAAMDQVDAALAALAIRIEPLTHPAARVAARLRAKHRGLRLPNALVLATADVLEAETILTADRAWSKISRRVRMISP